ncbi:UNVERIFIED_CONTAM: hypothetical protein PYX00_009381 [Menopon gallinae]|uniref:CWH43-like N-terminal domain-containing protein n=1 Tax=Menopon gallinae TaxID=328185 RepID=A0AAW2HBD3_9NEOP
MMSSTENLLPYYASDRKNIGFCVVIPFFKFGWAVLSLPFFSFVFCVAWSILYNFEEANSTHCSVPNYLPSISAAIGSFSPQKYIWMLAITFDFPLRMAITRLYANYFMTVIDGRYTAMYRLTALMNYLENIFLLGLTLVSSTTQYTFHAICFVSFLLSSMIYMGVSCFMLKFRRKMPETNLEGRIIKWKFNFFMANVLCFFSAAYFFYRHNAYCEPGVYSIFALFEYGVVLSNMSFHILAVYDFYGRSVIVTSSGIQCS